MTFFVGLVLDRVGAPAAAALLIGFLPLPDTRRRELRSPAARPFPEEPARQEGATQRRAKTNEKTSPTLSSPALSLGEMSPGLGSPRTPGFSSPSYDV